MKEIFNEINDQNHMLHDILPLRSQMTSFYNLRNKYQYQTPIVKKPDMTVMLYHILLTRDTKFQICVVFAMCALIYF
jgi:hypothetical protein